MNEIISSAKSWIQELQTQLGTESVIIALVGNKLDLESNRQVDREAVSKYANQNNFIHAEVSAKIGTGIEEVFQNIGERVDRTEERRQTILLNQSSPRQKKAKC